MSQLIFVNAFLNFVPVNLLLIMCVEINNFFNIINYIICNTYIYIIFFRNYLCSFVLTDDSNRMILCFKEEFIVALKGDSMNDIEQIGRYCIQVEPIGPQDREFLIYVHSLITIDGCLNETRLISSMMDNLQCLEEKHTEYNL